MYNNNVHYNCRMISNNDINNIVSILIVIFIIIISVTSRSGTIYFYIDFELFV